MLLPSLLCHLVCFCPGYLEWRTKSPRERLRAESTVWKMEGVTDNSEGKSQKCHTNTPSHAPIPDSRCTHTDFTRLKAAAFEGGRRGALFTDECVCGGRPPRACGCECAARHATARRRYLYLMQNILAVVLNGIKERKVYRELWARRARKEGKEREREDYFSSAGDKHGKTGIKNSLKEGFFGVISGEWGRRSPEVRRRGEQSYLVWCSCR